MEAAEPQMAYISHNTPGMRSISLKPPAAPPSCSDEPVVEEILEILAQWREPERNQWNEGCVGGWRRSSLGHAHFGWGEEPLMVLVVSG